MMIGNLAVFQCLVLMTCLLSSLFRCRKKDAIERVRAAFAFLMECAVHILLRQLLLEGSEALAELFKVLRWLPPPRSATLLA